MPRISPLQEYEKNFGKTTFSHIKLSRQKDAEIIEIMKGRSKLAPLLPKPILLPSSLDYSSFIHFVRHQGAWGCGMYAAAACWDIQNERKCPYSPNVSVNRQLWAHIIELRNEPIPWYNQTVTTLDDYLMNFGCPTEGTEPTDSDGVRWPIDDGNDECSNFKLAAHSTPIQVSVAQFKTSLAEKGPLRVGIWGNHFVALIGYDDATQKFKFINSWGDQFAYNGGYNGFGYVDYANLNQEIDGAEFFDYVVQSVPAARIAFNSDYRQDIHLWLGVEGKVMAKRVWPNGQRQDNSKNLNLTVTLPKGFQWPPKQGNRLYLDVYDSGVHSGIGGKVTEFTAAFNGQILKCKQLVKSAKPFIPHKVKRFYIG